MQLQIKLQRKISGKEAVIAGKGFTLFVFNKCTDDILIKKLLEDSGVLIDKNTKAVKIETNKQTKRTRR